MIKGMITDRINLTRNCIIGNLFIAVSVKAKKDTAIEIIILIVSEVTITKLLVLMTSGLNA